jgi:hypothetical protein
MIPPRENFPRGKSANGCLELEDLGEKERDRDVWDTHLQVQGFFFFLQVMKMS